MEYDSLQVEHMTASSPTAPRVVRQNDEGVRPHIQKLQEKLTGKFCIYLSTANSSLMFKTLSSLKLRCTTSSPKVSIYFFN